jgi:shikimate kinase
MLAKKLGMSYVSMDDEIVKKAGMPIPEIVDKFGWPGFRDLESEVARNFSGQDKKVIDTGGGVIERDENIEILKQHALVIWLKASVDTIVSRIQGGNERPALTAGNSFTEEVAEVLEKRSGRYRDAADHEIDTDGIAPLQISEQIILLQNSMYPKSVANRSVIV